MAGIREKGKEGQGCEGGTDRPLGTLKLKYPQPHEERTTGPRINGPSVQAQVSDCVCVMFRNQRKDRVPDYRHASRFYGRRKMTRMDPGFRMAALGNYLLLCLEWRGRVR